MPRADTISALKTNGWPAGTVFVAEPSDNGNPILGTLDLWNGKITALSDAFLSPRGLLFVPLSDAVGGDAMCRGLGRITRP
jgi:hypothetical protein